MSDQQFYPGDRVKDKGGWEGIVVSLPEPGVVRVYLGGHIGWMPPKELKLMPPLRPDPVKAALMEAMQCAEDFSGEQLAWEAFTAKWNPRFVELFPDHLDASSWALRLIRRLRQTALALAKTEVPE